MTCKSSLIVEIFPSKHITFLPKEVWSFLDFAADSH